MSKGSPYDWLCAELYDHSSLGMRLFSDNPAMRLRAIQGTVLSALRKAGLDRIHTTKSQLRVVIESLLGAELKSRGVADAREVCVRLTQALDTADLPQGADESPESLFLSLGRNR